MAVWLFHFRTGDEISTGSTRHAHGIGHARRCMTLMQEAHKRGIPATMAANNSEQTRRLLSTYGLKFADDENLEKVLSDLDCNVIFSDINYLDPDLFELYRRHAPCVCLAPRGPGKYLADIAFQDVIFEDEPPPPEGVRGTLFRGPHYAVTHPDFRATRNKQEQGALPRRPCSVCVSMGGVDAFDMTRAAVKALNGLPASWRIHILVGPLYPHETTLQETIATCSCPITIHRAPAHPMDILGACAYSVCAAGLVAYESIGLGVPCLTASLTPFHERRGQELEEAGTALHVGAPDHWSTGKLAHTLLALESDPAKTGRMREAGQQCVDGRGAERIIDTVQHYLMKTEA